MSQFFRLNTTHDSMIKIIIIIALASGIFVMFLHMRSQDRESGRNEQELKEKTKVIDNVKKAKDATLRVTDDISRKLRDKYGRK